MRGSARSGRSPHPSPPARTSPSSSASEPPRLDELREVLARLDRAEREDRRPAEVGRASPSGPSPSGEPGRRRARSAPRRSRATSTRSAAVKREFANTTSHVAAAWRALRVCIDTVRGVHHSGWWNGTRSWNTVARTPSRCGGYIHSLKTNASSGPTKRSTGGRPSRLQAVRSACDAGSRISPHVDRDAADRAPGSRPARAGSSARRRPARAGPPAAAAIPASEPRM